MSRSLARRYAPLAALIAVQLLIIATFPSKSQDTADEFDLSAGPGAGAQEGVLDEEGNLVDAETGEVIAEAGTFETGGGGGTGGTAGTGGPGGGGAPGRPGGGGGGGGGATETAAGDTSHCKDGRQHTATFYSPPCTPKWPKDRDNGGSTYKGVTKDKITIVRYNSQSDPAVDSLLASQDLSSSNEEELAFEAAAEKFINKYYELYGRKIDLVTFNGTCDLLPPQYDCLRNEVRKMVTEHQPFALFWNTPLASPFFDEASAQRVVNFGGWHFDDNFALQRVPFHFDPPIGGTTVVKHLSEYWCKRLAGKPAKYADDPLIQQKQRRLGVISPNDQANQRVAAEFRNAIKGCGSGVVAEYFYAQDIDRANEQRKAGIARMREADATTLVCICDGIAPYFMVITLDEERYYPELLLPGTGGMDLDAVGRLYQKSTQMDQFWGLSSLPNMEAWNNNDATRVWRDSGNSGAPYKTAFGTWAYYEWLANGIQLAGPNLNPGTFATGLFKMQRGGDPVHPLYAWGRSDFYGIDDMREVYWSSVATSSFDGKPGTWVPMNGGKRYRAGQWPGSEPVLPPKGQRG